eukprot:6488296-Amphidinium_carterae.1
MDWNWVCNPNIALNAFGFANGTPEGLERRSRYSKDQASKRHALSQSACAPIDGSLHIITGNKSCILALHSNCSQREPKAHFAKWFRNTPSL